MRGAWSVLALWLIQPRPSPRNNSHANFLFRTVLCTRMQCIHCVTENKHREPVGSVWRSHRLLSRRWRGKPPSKPNPLGVYGVSIIGSSHSHLRRSKWKSASMPVCVKQWTCFYSALLVLSFILTIEVLMSHEQCIVSNLACYCAPWFLMLVLPWWEIVPLE